jgi:hypothetical protein
VEFESISGVKFHRRPRLAPRQGRLVEHLNRGAELFQLIATNLTLREVSVCLWCTHADQYVMEVFFREMS